MDDGAASGAEVGAAVLGAAVLGVAVVAGAAGTVLAGVVVDIGDVDDVGDGAAAAAPAASLVAVSSEPAHAVAPARVSTTTSRTKVEGVTTARVRVRRPADSARRGGTHRGAGGRELLRQPLLVSRIDGPRASMQRRQSRERSVEIVEAATLSSW